MIPIGYMVNQQSFKYSTCCHSTLKLVTPGFVIKGNCDNWEDQKCCSFLSTQYMHATMHDHILLYHYCHMLNLAALLLFNL